MDLINDLTTIRQEAWNWLKRGTHDRHSPFRWGTVASRTSDGVSQRVVILRAVEIELGLLRFYTDYRSPKVSQIRQYPFISWNFYHPQKQVQLRLQGRADIRHQDECCKKIWAALPDYARMDYSAERRPGTPLPSGGLVSENPVDGFSNFTVIDCVIEQWDWLQLGRPAHQRACFSRPEKGHSWEGTWLVP